MSISVTTICFAVICKTTIAGCNNVMNVVALAQSAFEKVCGELKNAKPVFSFGRVKATASPVKRQERKEKRKCGFNETVKTIKKSSQNATLNKAPLCKGSWHEVPERLTINSSIMVQVVGVATHF